MNPYTHLSQDPILKKLIEEHGELSLPCEKEYFRVLCRAIISQQISNAAAASIVKRFEALFNEHPCPQKLLSFSFTKIKNVGLSAKKVDYLFDLAEHFKSGKITPELFDSMTDKEIIKELVAVHGIGLWTAEMFLMFSLGREDIFSYGDIGLLNAAYDLYFSGEKVSKKDLSVVVNTWAPYRSIASLYLWKSCDVSDSPW